MPAVRVFGPWPEHSNPAASCLQSSCVLQAAIVGKFFFACAHLTRGRCCTSNLIAPFFKRNCRYGLLLRLPHLQEKSLLDASCTGRCHAPALPFGRRDNTSTRFPLFRISISV